MTPEVVTPAYSLLQQELFEATGLFFDVEQSDREVSVLLQGVRVLGLPQDALDRPADTVRSFKFPPHLRQGAPTLSQRRAILHMLGKTAAVRSELHDVLSAETAAGIPEQLARLSGLESEIRDAICGLIWSLDDLAIQRLVNRLGV